jgi:mRNA-degrading endonuclease RelE of RelBE toxin-antitoxin system
MTELLSKAFKKASELPEDSQNILAKKLLEEIEDELKWEETFEKSKNKLQKMGDKAMEESNSGKTKKIGFDEL